MVRTLKSKGTSGPVVIWVSVYPDSTSVETAHEVSQKILKLFADNDMDGVKVEWCEAGNKFFLKPS